VHVEDFPDLTNPLRKQRRTHPGCIPRHRSPTGEQMLRKSLSSGVLVVGLVLSAAACSSDKAATPATTAAPATTAPDAAKPVDIVDTAVAAGSFKTLAAALTAAGLVDTLKGPGPFTVFAPTDEAFAKLPKGTLEDLLKPENKAKLAAILTYHVVSGKVAAADVVKLKMAKTVNGTDVTIAVTGADVMLNGTTKVTKTDIAASNGIIHVIDSVLLPA
jgi:uncharacterized surface protein with fasciclin (FAS1) repeats